MGREYDGKLVLASKGLFYDGKIPGGEVNCEALDTSGERMFWSRNRSFEASFDLILKKYTDIKIEPDELILQDRAHLFFYLRCLTYGNDYAFDFKCSECHKKVVINDFDLEKDLNVVYATDDMTEPFDLELPNSDVITWKMLRGKDETAVDRFSNRLKEKGNRENDPGYVYRLALRLVSINGQPCDNVTETMAYISKLKGKNMVAFRNTFRNFSLGVEPEINRECNWCHYPNKIVLPMDRDFFRFTTEATETDGNV